MFRTMLKSKIHRATVTSDDPDHIGSVAVDADLMDAADLLEGEQVTIMDVTSGARVERYVLAAERGTGTLRTDSATGDLIQPGDVVTLMSYGVFDELEARDRQPRELSVDADNRIMERGSDAGTAPESTELISRTEVSVETDDAAKLDALLRQPKP